MNTNITIPIEEESVQNDTCITHDRNSLIQPQTQIEIKKTNFQSQQDKNSTLQSKQSQLSNFGLKKPTKFANQGQASQNSQTLLNSKDKKKEESSAINNSKQEYMTMKADDDKKHPQTSKLSVYSAKSEQKSINNMSQGLNMKSKLQAVQKQPSLNPFEKKVTQDNQDDKRISQNNTPSNWQTKSNTLDENKLQNINQKNPQTTNNDDEFNDEFLDDSMELQEIVNTKQISLKQNQIKASPSKIDSNQPQEQVPSNNKIYTSSPSKLNSKFNQKQQNVKPSVIQQKRSIQSLQDSSKPLAQLELNLSMSNLQKINMDQIHPQQNNKVLRSIDLRSNRIKEIPEEFFQLESLWKVQLDNNLLEGEIYPQFKNLTQLKVLTLNSNQFKKVPDEIFEIATLEKLDISNNQITYISEKIDQLEKVKVLCLNDNLLQKVPLTICKLASLQTLSLEWFLYLKQNQDKTLKKIQLQQDKIKQEHQNNGIFNSVIKILSDILQQISEDSSKQINFIQFMQQYYKSQNEMDLLNNIYVKNKSTIFHFICQYNHKHLFELLCQKQYYQYLDINLENENEESPILIAINEKNADITDLILSNFHNIIEIDYAYKKESLNQRTQHPLILCLKKGLTFQALKIMQLIQSKSIMNSQNKLIFRPIIELNDIQDENNNTILHHIFQNFQNKMDMNVEMMQQIMKYNEKCLQVRASNCILKINHINNQGLTALDYAIEGKQYSALELAIIFNKNKFQEQNKQQNNNQMFNEKFDLNCNKNSRGMTLIHKAVILQHYQAISLLLQSNECNLFIKDKEFKTARDYCIKILYLQKYIKKGEMNYLFNQLQGKIENQVKFKAIIHNNINFFYMNRRNNRIKYNSWYKKLEQRNMLSSSQQVTLEQKDEGYLKNKMDQLMSNENQEDIEVEDVDHNEEDSCKQFTYLHTEEEQILVDEYNNNKRQTLSIANQETKNDKLVQNQVPSFLSTKVNNPPASNFKDKRNSLLSQKKPQGSNYQSSQQSSVKGSTQNINGQNKNSFKSQNNMLKNKNDHNQQNKLVRISEIQPYQEQQKIDMLTLNSHFDEDEIEDNNDECKSIDNPSSILNQQNKYVMIANSSKLARRPYYKDLQKNQFEREFLILMDQSAEIFVKIQTLYKIFIQFQNNSMNQQIQVEIREIFTYLSLEIKNNEEVILPLKNEIEYIKQQIEKDTGSLIIVSSSKGGQNHLSKGPLPIIKENFQDEINKTRFSDIKVENQRNNKIQQTEAKLKRFGLQNKNQQNNIAKEIHSIPSSSRVMTQQNLPQESQQQSLNQQKLNTNSSQKSLENLLSKQINPSLSKTQKTNFQDIQKTNIPVQNRTSQPSSYSSKNQLQQSSQQKSIPQLKQSQTLNTKKNVQANQQIKQDQRSSISSQQNNYKSKDSHIKKIEVQLKDKTQASKLKQPTLSKTQQVTKNVHTSNSYHQPQSSIKQNMQNTIESLETQNHVQQTQPNQNSKISTPQSQKSINVSIKDPQPPPTQTSKLKQTTNQSINSLTQNENRSISNPRSFNIIKKAAQANQNKIEPKNNENVDEDDANEQSYELKNDKEDSKDKKQPEPTIKSSVFQSKIKGPSKINYSNSRQQIQKKS